MNTSVIPLARSTSHWMKALRDRYHPERDSLSAWKRTDIVLCADHSWSMGDFLVLFASGKVVVHMTRGVAFGSRRMNMQHVPHALGLNQTLCRRTRSHLMGSRKRPVGS